MTHKEIYYWLLWEPIKSKNSLIYSCKELISRIRGKEWERVEE